MKVKEWGFANGVDTLVYCILCIATLGVLFMIRLAITKGIQKALTND